MLELVAEEVELPEYAIVGYDTMKRETDSRVRIERIQEMKNLYLSHTITLTIDYMI